MTPIDLCIALNGPLVGVLLPLMMHTLLAHQSLDGIQLHFVNKDCDESVGKYLNKLSAEHDAIIHHMPHMENAERDATVFDVGKTCQWMLDNCGRDQWCFICHFDMEFTGPWINHCREMIRDGVGQIGFHSSGLVGYNREAVAKCQLRFESISGCCLVRDEIGDWKVRHESDQRCIDKSMRIMGWDVGELLELNLGHLEYEVITETIAECQKWRIHNGSGCGRCGDDVNRMIHDRTVIRSSELGITA